MNTPSAECPVCDTPVAVHNTPTGQRFEIHGDCPGGFSLVRLAKTDLESRYTPPNEFCPYPERWHSADWDSAEHEVTNLVAAFVGALRPDIAVETGTAFGQTAQAIGSVLAGVGVGTLHTIEVDPERARMAAKVLAELPVEVHEMSSMDFDPPGMVGFAWFDSLPSLRVPEFRRYYPYMADGAIVGFHDVAPHHGKELWREILTLEAQSMLLPIRLRTPRGVVFAEVMRQ